ncbi:MAG: protein rep [[Clostridium] cellulosi]
MIHQIIPIINTLKCENRGIYHMTLTIPNVPKGELDSACERMAKGFKKFWNWLSNNGKKRYTGRKYKAIGALRSLEITYNAQTRTWHPHYHVLIVLSDRLKDDYLKQNIQTAWDNRRGEWTLHSRAEIDTGQLWASAYNGRPPSDGIEAYECRINKIKDKRGLIEVLKYPAKESDFARMDLTEFTEFYQTVKFRRTRQAYGVFYNVKLDDNIKNEDMLEVDLLKSLLHIPEEPEILVTAYDTLIQDYHSWRKISRYRAHDGFNMGAEDAENVSNNAENVSKQTKTDTFSAQNVSKSAENISKSQHIIDIQLSIKVNSL